MTLRGLVNPTSTRLQDGARLQTTAGEECASTIRSKRVQFEVSEHYSSAQALFEASDKSLSLSATYQSSAITRNMQRASDIPFNFLQSPSAHLNLVTSENYQTNSSPSPDSTAPLGLSCVYVSCLRASQREEINIK